MDVTHSANSQPKANAGKGSKAQLTAAASGPYVIYFCSKPIAKTAGVGTTALRALIKKGVRPARITVFESVKVTDAFKKAGFKEFYKVIPARENAKLIRKYKVRQDNTLVFCAPNGDMVACLAGMNCNQTNTLKLLKSWKTIYQTWQTQHAANKR